jgi:hypothetical protein
MSLKPNPSYASASENGVEGAAPEEPKIAAAGEVTQLPSEEVVREEAPVKKNKFFSPDYASCKNYLDRVELFTTFPHLRSLEEAEKIDF